MTTPKATTGGIMRSCIRTLNETVLYWDMGFYINENNMDHYPLTEPVTIAEFDSESLYPPLSYDKPAQEPPIKTISLAIIAVALVGTGLAVYFRKKSKL